MKKITATLLLMSLTACLNVPNRQTHVYTIDLDNHRDTTPADAFIIEEVVEPERDIWDISPFDSSDNSPVLDLPEWEDQGQEDSLEIKEETPAFDEFEEIEKEEISPDLGQELLEDLTQDLPYPNETVEEIAQDFGPELLDSNETMDLTEEDVSIKEDIFIQPCFNDPTICDDKNPCTDDECYPIEGCTHTNNTIFCDDGDACTENDTCVESICQGTPLHCQDEDLCTEDACTPGIGCVHQWICECHSANDCVDSNLCTDDICLAGSCQNVPNNLSCDDFNACTTNDVCSNNKCGGETLGCDDGNSCTNDQCNNSFGCWYENKSGPCDNNDVCTMIDTCEQGQCVGSMLVDCDDGNICTLDVCHPTIGCLHSKLTNSPCLDNDPCTENDTCQNGSCTSGTEICECRTNADCVDDGDLCNGLPFCNKAVWPYRCETDATTVVSCDSSANTPCLNNLCQPQTGNCEMTAVNEGGECGEQKQCIASTTCQAGQCIVVNKPDNTVCDDGLNCNSNDKCYSGICLPSPILENNFNNEDLPTDWKVTGPTWGPQEPWIWKITTQEGFTSPYMAFVTRCIYETPVQITSPTFYLEPNNNAILKFDRKANSDGSEIRLKMEISLQDEQQNSFVLFTDDKQTGWDKEILNLDQFFGSFQLTIKFIGKYGCASSQSIDSISINCL